MISAAIISMSMHKKNYGLYQYKPYQKMIEY